MPPTHSYNIKQNTPEAEKLIERLHEQLKELWDPAADATVPRYLTAMLAKGYDRKKISAKLKTIIHDAISSQLLDWLFKHLRLHGSEYQSKEAPASSKPAPKPPTSVAKVLPTEEVELRLEDLEAQQLEGSDLEDDAEANDTAAPQSAAAEAVGLSKRDETAQPLSRNKGVTQPEGPAELAGQPLQGATSGDMGGSSAPAGGKPQRSERRHREPIPIPNFTDAPRARSGGGSGPHTQQPVTTHGGPPAGASPLATAALAVKRAVPPPSKLQTSEQEEQQQEQEPSASAVERRRLKSSVVLDWDTWQKQKQPGDNTRGSRAAAAPEKAAAPERVQILPRGQHDGADQPSQALASQHEREDGRERDRDRERGQDRDRGRRRQPSEAEANRSGTRRRDGDGDALARSGHDRESEGAGRRKGGETTHRSRSRSRSRSPRGRRSGRAPLGMANLLRSALREVDGMAGTRGSKPSVFERLGASGAPAEPAPARVPALQRLGGTDKGDRPERAMDTSGSGRKRGPEDGADADAAVLESPPKAARGRPAQRPGSSAGDERRPTGAGTGSATGRKHLEVSVAAVAPAAMAGDDAGLKPGSQMPDAGSGPRAADGAPTVKHAAVAAAPVATVEAGVDPKAAELEALRQQMAAMAEKLARMEAAKEVSMPPQVPPQPAVQPQVQPQPQPMPSLQSEQQQLPKPRQPDVQPGPQSHLQMQPQSQVRLQPQLSQPQQQQVVVEPRHVPIAARLQPPGPAIPPAVVMGGRPAPAGGMVAMAAGSRGAGTGGAIIMPTSMSDVVIEGGSGSPPRRPVGQPEPPMRPLQPRVDQQRLAAAQLEADLRSVVVENVHLMASKEVVAAHFGVAGPVKNVTLVMDRLTGRPTGVAVVEMANEKATQEAAVLTGSLLMNMPIVVTLKAELLLQGMNMAAGVGMRPVVAGPAGMVLAGRLNPTAAPFVPAMAAIPGAVPGAGLGRGTGGAVGPAELRPPLGAVASAGRQPWMSVGGGRGRGSNVWVREPAARTGKGAGS